MRKTVDVFLICILWSLSGVIISQDFQVGKIFSTYEHISKVSAENTIALRRKYFKILHCIAMDDTTSFSMTTDIIPEGPCVEILCIQSPYFQIYLACFDECYSKDPEIVDAQEYLNIYRSIKSDF